MKSNILNKTVLTTAFLALAGVGCSSAHKADSDSVSANSRAASAVGAHRYVTLDFNKGKTGLTESSRASLRNLTADIPAASVDEILVLAWADKEYPAEGQKASSKDVDLAADRAEAVDDYIKDDLGFRAEVDKHNMAKRPNMLAELLKTEDYDVKTNLEATGNIPVAQRDEPIILSRKASTALVMVKYSK